MNNYEHTIIARQDTSASQIKQIKDKYSDIIIKNNGDIVQTQDWGLMNLSYLIKKNKKGNYIHFKIKGDGSLIKELEKNEKLDKNLLRFLTVKVKVFDLKTNYTCKNCKNSGKVRVDVVWFGEQPKYLDIIYRNLDEAEVFISVGTSNNVYPAAGFIDFALQLDRQIEMYEFNIEKTNKSSLFNQVITGPASKTLPNFVKKISKD